MDIDSEAGNERAAIAFGFFFLVNIFKHKFFKYHKEDEIMPK